MYLYMALSAFPRFLTLSSACAALAGARDTVDHPVLRCPGPTMIPRRARLRVKSRAFTQSQLLSPTRLRRITRRVVRRCAIASV